MSVLLQKEFNTKLSMDIKSVILESVNIAEKYAINMYLIGGIVRDLIIDNPVKDIDITLEFDAIEFTHILKKEIDCEIIQEQENLRTAKVKFYNGIEIDFATTREEYYLKQGTLPIANNFGCTLENDVKRRDFTINTLALKLTGENKYSLVDFYNGYQDILDKKIKILHDNSFIDDPSRIIRALKFQTRFDFDIEKNTYDLMQNYLENIPEDIPFERIKNEFKQYCAIKKNNLYKNLIDKNVYKLFSQNPYKEVLDDEIKIDENKWLVYLILLIINNDKINEKLNLTSEEKKNFMEVKYLLLKTTSDDFEIYKKYYDKNVLSILIYQIMTKDNTVKKFLTELQNIKVFITGRDLINLGYTPSKEFSAIFDKILQLKLEGKLITKEDEINYIKKNI